MAVKGVFASDQNIQGTRKGDFAGALLKIDPTGNAPLLALSSGMESIDASDTVVTWFEENHLSGRINVTNNAGTGVSLVVDDVTQSVAGAIYLSEASGEHVFVTGVDDATKTLTVIRGFAGTTATAIDGSVTPKPIQKLGTAYEEGSAKPTSVANLGYPRFNYMQLFRNPWDVTGTARAVEYYTGNIVAKNQRDASLMHAEDIERSMWFARKSYGVKNNKPFRTMDGVQAQITTNVQAAGATTQQFDITNFLQTVFERNIKGKPNERIAFCGNDVVKVVNQIAQKDGVMNLQPGQTDFGMKIMQWLTPFGTITLMTHPLFVENPTWTKDLHVLHPGAVRLRWLRRTHEDRNDRDGTRAGADADFGVFTSELCIEYRAERTGGRMTGFTAGAAQT